MDKTVLVVDDDEAAARMLAALIRAHGYDARTADSGLAALCWMAERTPDLIVLDMMMPEMDGLAVLRIMRADPRLESIPAVMFSAVADPNFQRYAIEEGASECWLKGTFDYHSLPQRLARLMEPASDKPRGDSPNQAAGS